MPAGLAGRGLSGADIESIVLAAKRTRTHAGARRSDAAKTSKGRSNDFIPSAQGLEKEKQELAAVLECTSMSFLPDAWRARVARPDGRASCRNGWPRSAA